MSHLGTVLKSVIEDRGTTARAIALKSGLNEATFSRWMNGSRKLISIPSLIKVAGALGRTQAESAEIIAAHLRDQCEGPGADLIDIRVNGKQPARRSSEVERALTYLRSQAVKDAPLRQLIILLAKMHRRE